MGYSSKGSVSVQHSTMIDIDPDFPDAQWLRKYAAGLTKKESLCLEFPEGVWDVEAAEYGVYRNLYTLAEIDEWSVVLPFLSQSINPSLGYGQIRVKFSPVILTSHSWRYLSSSTTAARCSCAVNGKSILPPCQLVTDPP